MKNLLLLIVSLFVISCNETKTNGLFLLTIKLQDQNLKTIIEIDKDKGKLFNSKETLELSKKENGYKIGNHYSVLAIDFEEQSGKWIRENKEDYQVDFFIEPTKIKDLFKEYESKQCSQDISGNYQVRLSETKTGLGIFTQTGCRLKGSILTTTGDYRYLDGYIKDNLLHLQGFDGVFSFVFKLDIKEQKLNGTMYAGRSYKTKITAFKDNNFKLADANSMTQIKPHKRVTLDTFDINGRAFNINSEQFNNKPKIIQLFGSWCPNCLDETKFFNQWRKENKELADKVVFIALAFEDFDEEKKAIRALKKAQKSLDMDYPLILIDYNKTIKPSDVLPIDKARAFPTTLYLNKKNQIIKVHTGFAGQATGIFFEEFADDFNNTLKDLIN